MVGDKGGLQQSVSTQSLEYKFAPKFHDLKDQMCEQDLKFKIL